MASTTWLSLPIYPQFQWLINEAAGRQLVDALLIYIRLEPDWMFGEKCPSLPKVTNFLYSCLLYSI